jgi:hypothetical protein
MQKYQVEFERLYQGSEFSLNGNRYFKRSLRTAEIIKPEQYAGTWFYMGMKELCITTNLEDVKECK